MLFHLLLYLIFAVDLLTAVTIIFIERESAVVTWAWLMVLLFIPVGGFVLYLLFGQHVNRFRMYKTQRRTREVVDALVQYQKERLSHNQIVYKDVNASKYADIMYMNLMSSYAFFTQDNQVCTFTNGVDKFEQLFDDIRNAKSHIHIAYYIFRDDRLGNTLIQLLSERARNGVEVRLLYDDVGSAWTSNRLFEPLIQAGGFVASFFPSRIPYVNFRMNHRNHRKLVIIDGGVGYIGGFNVGDEYLGLNARFGKWRDTHLRIEGSAVLEMQGIFLLDWNSASVSQIPITNHYFPALEHQGQIGLQVVSSGPASTWEPIRNAYIKMIYSAKSHIYIQTPYFIPDESLMTALKTASLSGVEVHIMLPLKPDHRLVYWASKFYLGELLESGIRCHLYGGGFLHAKTMVVDGTIASVGTANIDIRSFKLNFEVNALIFDTRTATQLADIYLDDLKLCEELTMQAYRDRSRLSKIAESCARLLSPIL